MNQHQRNQEWTRLLGTIQEPETPEQRDDAWDRIIQALSAPADALRQLLADGTLSATLDASNGSKRWEIGHDDLKSLADSLGVDLD